VRTKDWKLIHYVDQTGMDELYDLKRDPYEMKNLATDPKAKDALAKMQAELAKVVKETGRK
jgi:arylsulfatase A-like enzyme